ncbi:unnamed protein product [Penicillium nalgiovense]|nr:unnamed protein product [Penicillium nalgiovense]
MDKPSQNGPYHLVLPTACAHNELEHDFDLDVYAIWRESSCIPTPAPSLAADYDVWLGFFNVAEPAAYEAQGHHLVECFFHPNQENQSGFKWTGPDPLSFSTLADDLFLYLSTFFLAEEVYRVEFRLARFDQLTGERVGEHMFFLPRVETIMGNLRRVRGQILDIISRAAVGAMAPCFRLSQLPRLEQLPYSSHSTLSPLAVLPRLYPWILHYLYKIPRQITSECSPTR